MSAMPRRVVLFLFALFVVGLSVHGQNITKLEYFFDTDPGHGKGTAVSVTPATDVTANFSVDIASLSAGFHSLYVRGYIPPYQVTENGNPTTKGGWSLTNVRSFYKQSFTTTGNTALSPIVAGEYFVDADPGFGKGTGIPVSQGTDLTNIAFAFDITSLTTGFHKIYVRFRDANGVWSHIVVKSFYKESVSSNAGGSLAKVTGGEYFIDTDPGFGKGIAVAVTQSTDINNLSFTADVTSLQKGFHQLYLRFKDANGVWGQTNNRSFYKETITSLSSALAKVVRLEYFVDADPGFGKGTKVAVTPTLNDSLSFFMDMTNVSIGNHKVYVRAQDEQGVWSMISSGNFKINPPSDLIIKIGDISATVCVGSKFAVPYSVNGPFGSNNIFTVQLSDYNGSFTNPTNIGTLTKNTGDTIQATIPAGISASNNYKIRVIASSPLDTSGASGAIAIKRVPEAYYVINGTSPVCLGTTTYSISQADAAATVYNWSLTGGGTLDTTKGTSVKVNWTTAGQYTVKVTAGNACGNGGERTQPVRVYAGKPIYTPSITASGNTLSVTRTPSTDSVYAYKWYKDSVAIPNATNYFITASQDGKYTVAYTNPCGEGPMSNMIQFIANKQSQTINFTPVADKIYGQVSYVKLVATASSGLSVTYSLLQGSGTIKADTLNITSAGIFKVRASQAGDLTYAPATAEMSFEVKKAAAQITFSNLTQVYNGSAKQPTVTTTPSGLSVSLTFNGATTVPVNAGMYKVVATVNNTNYQGADSASFVIQKASQTITLAKVPDLPLSTPNYKIAATASSGLPVSLSLTASPVGSVVLSNDTLYAKGVGTGYLVVTQAGNANYDAAPTVKDTFDMKKATQVINFPAIADKTWGSAPFALNATASSNLPVSYKIISGPATLNGSTVTLTGLGTVVIEASQAGNSIYNAATPVQRSFAVIAYPDLYVQNVTADKSTFGPGENATVSWKVSNIGSFTAPVKWTERIYMQSTGGANKTVISLINFTDVAPIDTGKSINRSAVVTLPASLNIGDHGYFVVELVPDTAVHEQAGNLANNTAVQTTAWNIKKVLSFDLSANQINEGAATGVTGTISRSGSLTNALTVNITAKYPQRFTLPTTVTIPAGQAGTSFTIGAPDNNVVEGNLLDTIQVAATGFASTTEPLTLIENDQATLTFTNVPGQVNEGDVVSFKVNTNLAPSTPLTVYLTSSNSKKFPVPASVIIPTGSTTANVSVTIDQNTTPEVDQTIELKAGAANHNPAVTAFTIKDDDLPNLELVLQTTTVSEGAGIYATQATLRRTSTGNPVAFTANLSASASNTLILPGAISLAANENEKTFTIGVIDNTLAEGQRQVTITASVYVNSCGCTAPPTSSGSVSANLTINDNDGPTLTLTATPLTLPEGAANAGALRITRNTSTAASLTVNLSTSDSSEAILPATATIPVGKSFVDVPITTINDGITDGSQTVYFQVKATGFSTGSVWVIVTDQNKPDLLVQSVNLSDSNVQALNLFNYNVAIKNNGFATAPTGLVVHGYLSKDDIIDATDTLLTIDTLATAIPAGQSSPLLNAVKAPNKPGKYKLLFKVNPESTMTELLLTNNTAQPVTLNIKPDYTATAVVQPTYFLKGDTVRISGAAKKANNTVAANVPVEVYIITQGFRRTVTAITNGSGNYNAAFVPMLKEFGHYSVGASFPGMDATDEQDAFDILGIRLNDGNAPTFLVKGTDTLTGTMKVQNLSNQSLTNLSLKPSTLPNGAVVRFDTLSTLAGNATSTISYKVSGTSLTSGNNYHVGVIQAVAKEGVIQDQSFNYYCQAPKAYLIADISKMNVKVSATTGEQVVEFRVVNRGSGESGEIKVDLPQANWIRSITPKVLPSLSQNDTAVVIVKFLALSEVPFEYPINGNIAINCANGSGISVPFTFEKVSLSTGVARITITDQFTYYAQGGPKVAGAHVVIRNYFTGVQYAEGFTDANGLFVTQGIPEGKHRVVVDKDKHQSYDGTITINPGDTVDKEVFLNYQAITFDWKVVPTTVQDQYNIDLEAKFETHVPMPVVTMEMPKVLPQLSGTDTYAFNITMTNHGLITAQSVDLKLPVDPEYEFVTNYQTMDLLAQQSIQVPVIMRRKISGGTVQRMSLAQISQFLNMKTQGPADDAACLASALLTYLYSCGIHPVGGAAGAMAQIAGRTCDGFLSWLPNIGNIFGDAAGGGGTGGSVGGGNNTTNASNNPSTGYTNSKSNCDPGIDDYINGGGGSGARIAASKGSSLKTEGTTTYQPSAALKEAVESRNLARTGLQLRDTINREYFGLLPKRDGWQDMYEPIQPQVKAIDSIRSPLQQSVLQKMQGYEITSAEIQAAFNRWNTSIGARKLGVMEPNTQYPSIINWNLTKFWSDSLGKIEQTAIQKGYTSIDDMYEKSVEAINQIVESQKNAVCASVKVQFSQKLTMTREAFRGTLDIFNGHPTDKMDSITVNIQITDKNGVPANGLFQINTESLTNMSDVTGTGAIIAQQHGTVQFLFIPTINAAPTVPVAYNFGGSVTYWDPYVKAKVTMPLNAVELTVNPSPNLMLHYFMQRNILGDDPLTSPAIEPSIPAELSVMIENQGYGPAVNVNISSAQPKVVENEKGLAINFQLIGSNFQGQPTKFGITDINFGTIPALQTRVGQWYFTSSLLGKFVSYEANVVHANSFGNPELSLIKGVKLHELTKSIKVYGGADDGINDFLVNDIFDVNDVPDILYYSQGMRTEKVVQATSGSFDKNVGSPTFTNKLTVTPSDIGWNYIKLNDPGNGLYELVSVTRSDNQVIPLNNAWLTFVTLPVGRTPVYENKFQFIDSFPSKTAVTYTVVWKPKNLNVPSVVKITGAPDATATDQVKNLTVIFDKPIDPTTFGREDLTLTFQGGANIIDANVTITKVDSVTFNVDLSKLTTGNGFYAFTVQAAGIKDIYGISGTMGKQVTWTQFLSIPTVQAFKGLPAGNIAASFETIQVQFNLPIDEISVTPQRFTITKSGVTQSGTVTIDSVSTDKKTFYLSGLGAILTQSGDYLFSVDMSKIKSTTNVFGTDPQSVKLTVDKNGPTLVSISKVDSGGLDPQHIPFVRLQFNEDVAGLNTSALKLTRDGQVVSLSADMLSSVDPKTWLAGNFGVLTYPDGAYTLTIDMSKVKDAIGNSGTDTQSLSWTVNRASLITISSLSISPDLGFLNTDGITSGDSLMVSFNISNNASQVTISQVDVGGETVLTTVGSKTTGAVSIPVLGLKAGNTSLKVLALGANGGTTTATKSLYIDNAPLTGQWQFAVNQTLKQQVDTIPFLFSAKLLSNTGLLNAVQLKRNDVTLPNTGLVVKQINDTLYQLSGLRQASNTAGTYQLLFNLQSLKKYSSGIAGSGIASTAWTVLNPNKAPIAVAGKDITITQASTVMLNGSASSDPDGNQITYRWVAPQGITLNDSTLAKPSFTVTAANNGNTYPFLLIVSDGDLYSTSTVKVTVRFCGVEVCNGIDDDCDGQIDEGFQITYYKDNDGDGFGIASQTAVASQCAPPAGYAPLAGDCDDSNAAVYPGSDGDGCSTCTTDGVTFYSASGQTFQWQVDDGTGFKNIQDNSVYTGTTQKYLQLKQPPTSWSGYKYRCVVSNNGLQSYSPVRVLKFTFTWKGTVSTAWENPQNWSCNKVPDQYTDVKINNTNPVVISAAASAKSVTLSANSKVTINKGASLNVKK
jgi:hypothetical protein